MAFQNELLSRLLEGVLQNHEITIRTDLVAEAAIMEAIDLLPLSLSERQQDAISKAWRSEMSYVQGPPGTGKSHTITAIMLSALFLGKRVLMVSHKKPAVEIVRNELKKHLEHYGVIYLGPTKAQRDELRGELRSLCQQAQTSRAAQRLQELVKATRLQEQRTHSLQSEVRDIQKRLKNALECEKQFHVKNEEFLECRDQFVQDFEILDPTKNLRLAERVLDRDVYQRQLSKARQFLERDRQESAGYLARKKWLFLRRFFKKTVSSYHADPTRLTSDSKSTLYLERHLELTLAYQETVNARHRITDDSLVQLRRMLAPKERQLRDTKGKFVRAKFAEHIAEYVREFTSDVGKFSELLRRRDPRRIAEVMRSMDFPALIETFPLWVGEMRYLGEFLPFLSGLFDLVIVDESSQVNIAEIVPALYRGSRFCVVGDKKQLGLSSVGLFHLNRTFEELAWNHNFGTAGITLATAGTRSVVVSKNSILDFVTSGIFRISQATLNEHFRSLPQLASFTNTFYQDDGGLRLMTEVPKNIHKVCFEAIEVGGQREDENKIVPNEVEKVLTLLKGLIHEQNYTVDERFKSHGFTAEHPPTIGIISILTDQRNYIQTRIDETFNDEEMNRHDLMVGTPEDFQGNERHIIVLTLGLDGTSRWNKGHYEDEHRFNVATSRAINFTYVIFGGIPQNANLIKRYLRHFGVTWSATGESVPAEETTRPTSGRYAWRYHPDRRESEFEIRVDEYLHKFISDNGGNSEIELYNQVESCGQKRLDFVLFNKANDRCCAVEVDGQHHFCKDGRCYSDEHLERVAILKRADWDIVHVPYYHWYHHGWLCDRDDPKFLASVERLFVELRTHLGIP